MGLAIRYNEFYWEEKDPEVLTLIKEFLEMTDMLKLEELFYRMDADGTESVGEEFCQILQSLPVHLVSETCVCRKGTLLQRALWEDNNAHAKLLLDFGVDPDKTCRKGHSEAYRSRHHGESVVIKTNNSGETRERIPVEIAFDKGNKELLNMLTETGVTDYIRLGRLVREMRWESVSEPTETFKENLGLLDLEMANSFSCHWAGTEFNHWGGNLLQTAVKLGKVEHVRLILEKGVDSLATSNERHYNMLMCPSRCNTLPFLIACEDQNLEIVKILGECMVIWSRGPYSWPDELKLKQLACYIICEGRESASEGFCNVLNTLPLRLVRLIINSRCFQLILLHSR